MIGNGPSLSSVDLTPLGGEVTFVSNAFWKHPVLSLWQPSYYCLLDQVFFDESEMARIYFSEIRQRAPSSTFVVPMWPHKAVPTVDLIEGLGWLPAEQTYYFAVGEWLFDEIPSQIDATHLLPRGQCVAQLSIMMALFMGCSPIYLLGLDHDWLARPGLFQHFYEGGAGFERHPTVLAKQQASMPYSAAIEYCANLWKGYRNLASFAMRAGVPIVNLTEGGFLDVFPQSRLATVLEARGR